MNVYFLNDSNDAVIAHEVLDSIPREGEYVMFTVKGPALKVVSVIWELPIRAVHVRVA